MTKILIRIAAALFLFATVSAPSWANNDPAPPEKPASGSTMEIIGAFGKKDDSKSDIVSIPDQKKRLVMFLMGVPLLLFILITAALGIAMGVYGKPVYVPHMIFAGLSATLAIAHAIVGIAWFYPF